MKTKTKITVFGGLLALILTITFAFALIMPTTLTAHAAEREREIVAVDSGNGLNMSIDDQGLLTWDAVAGATGYSVSASRNDLMVGNWNTANTVIFIVSELDSLKIDSGSYAIEVYAQGTATRASISYYYNSNVDKLETPHGLKWIGNKAGWEAVDGAIEYRVMLYDFSGAVVTKTTSECLYDFSEYNPQGGWTFKVQARSNGTLKDKRHSNFVESPAKGSRTRTTSEIVTGNSLHMTLSESEVLSWDSVDGATGYRVAVKRNNMEVAYFETTYNFFALTSQLDGAKLDSAQYVIEVEPQGVAVNSASMSYYYTSHVDQLESPYNLHWNGTQACWTPVAGATLYSVTLYDFNGVVFTVSTEEDYYDFAGNSPEDGWTFKVQARSNGTLNAPRNSVLQESPAKETTYSIYCVAPENGSVSLTTNKGSQSGSSAVLSATKGTEVTVTATPNSGYEFVAWRHTAPAQPAYTVSTDLTYTFKATNEIHIFAVFTDKYTVSYNGNGGGGVEMQGAEVNVGDTLTLEDCTYTAPGGKEFKGWAVGSVDAWPLKQPGDEIEVHSDTTIYAIWDNTYIIKTQPTNTSGKIGANVPVSITIDFTQVPNDSNEYIVLEVQNGGNWDQVSAMTRSSWVSEFHDYTGSFNTLSNTACTKTYRYKVYDGTEWIISDTFEVEFLPLVVTFVDNVHTTMTEPINVYEYNTLITEPVQPSFTGDTFYSWKRVIGGTTFDFANDRVTQDIELSADWAGCGYYGNIPDVYAKLNAKARIDLSNVYSNNSYTYVYKYDGANWVQVENVTNYGWYDLAASATEKTENYKIVIKHSEDIESNVFTVTWTDTVYSVMFNGNGGTDSMENVETIGTYKLPANKFGAPDGKRFVGWAVGSADTLPLQVAGDQITVLANTTVYAVWEEIPTYLVVYGVGEGQGSGDYEEVEEGTEYTVDSYENVGNMVAPEGQQFAYWSVRIGNAMSEEVAQIQAGGKITITANTYLIAIWEDIPHSHTMQATPAKAATCTEKGNIAYWYCTECEKYFSDAEGENEITLEDTVVAALGHNWGEWVVVTPATCTTVGEKTRTCANDENHKEHQEIAAIGHDFGEWTVIKAATETEEGLERRVCSRDANHIEERAIPVIGHVHTIVAVEAKAATCTEAGNTPYYECSACHRYFSDAEGTHEINTEDFIIPALGHDWGEWVVTTPAQVGVKGVETRVCFRDANHKETSEIPALPYEYNTVDGVIVYSETLVAGQTKDLSILFEQAKAQNGKIELTAGTLKLTFNAAAVSAIGGNTANLTANVLTENFGIENLDGIQTVIEITLVGATFESGSVRVELPFATAVPNGKLAKVYYVNGNDKTDMNGTFEGGKVVFDTNHFSKFAVVFEDEQQEPTPTPVDPSVEPTEKGGLSGGAIAGIVIAVVVVVLGGACVCLVLLNKKGIIHLSFLDKLGKKGTAAEPSADFANAPAEEPAQVEDSANDEGSAGEIEQTEEDGTDE